MVPFLQSKKVTRHQFRARTYFTSAVAPLCSDCAYQFGLVNGDRNDTAGVATEFNWILFFGRVSLINLINNIGQPQEQWKYYHRTSYNVLIADFDFFTTWGGSNVWTQQY